MKCPHCAHKQRMLKFIMTLMNPWRIRCSQCNKHHAIGRRGKGILVVGAFFGIALGFGIHDQPIWLIAVLACAYGATIEILIWAIDEPVKIIPSTHSVEVERL